MGEMPQISMPDCGDPMPVISMPDCGDPMPQIPTPGNTTTLWVLDLEGYDARGGWARVFSSKERAKAAVPHVKKWLPSSDDGRSGEYEDVGNSTMDMYTVYPVELDAAD